MWCTHIYAYLLQYMILLGSLQGSLRQYEQHEIAFLDTNNNFKHIYLYASSL